MQIFVSRSLTRYSGMLGLMKSLESPIQLECYCSQSILNSLMIDFDCLHWTVSLVEKSLRKMIDFDCLHWTASLVEKSLRKMIESLKMALLSLVKAYLQMSY